MPTKKVTESPKKVVQKKVTVSPAKKAIAKKVVKSVKKPTCSCEVQCAATHAFWVNNGPVVNSLDGLLRAFKEMSDEQYVYHTKRDGNDFAKWVKECLKDAEVATGLKLVKSRDGAIRFLSKKCTCA